MTSLLYRTLLSILCAMGLCAMGLLATAAVCPAVEGAPAGDPTEALKEIQVLDLQTAAHIALAGNPSLAAAQARVMQAGQVVRQAQAPYWPQLDAKAGVVRMDLSEREIGNQRLSYDLIRGLYPPGTAPSFESVYTNPEEYYSAGLTATWLIFDGLAREFTLAAARYGEKASQAARDDVERLLLSAVTIAYLQSQLALENVKIANEDERFNKRQLVEARLRYEVGTGALSDVLNFEVRVNAAKSARIQEERGYRAGLASLAALLGLPQGRLPAHVGLAELAPTTPPELAEPDGPGSVALALSLRPDLKRYDWIVQQADAGVKTARAGYYPTLALSAAYDGERPEDFDFESDDFGNSVGVGLTWNLFAGGLTRARTSEARARLYETEKLRGDAQVQVASEIEKIIAEIESAQGVLRLQESNTALVQQQRDLVEKEYRAGVGSLVRLNQAQRDLNVSQSQLALARVALRVSWYNLQTATGQILETFKN